MRQTKTWAVVAFRCGRCAVIKADVVSYTLATSIAKKHREERENEKLKYSGCLIKPIKTNRLYIVKPIPLIDFLKDEF